ncbi:DNA polymerase [Planktomarina temperata]|nr:DNA polymerase [Planktomarina temperata]
MLFEKSNFDTIHTGKADPSRYLIIGFDTEYQRYADDETKTLNNEVLSYQYSCLIIEKDTEVNDSFSWSGLVKPKGPLVTDRLSLKEFLITAVQDGLRKAPNALLPSTIYLVAHFTRADVPSFSDFKDEATRSALQLDNIRNLFMNVANDIRLDLGEPASGNSIPISVKIRDTMTLAPSGAKSLAAIGDILGFEKIELGSTPQQELSIKQNMKSLMEHDWDTFEKYAIRDAEICTQYTRKMIRLYQERTGKFRMPVTLTSIGVDLIKQFWKDQGVSPLEIVGKEEIKEKYWSKRFGRYQTKKKIVYLKKIHWSLDFFTECYHGGRNEQFWFGPAFDSVWYDYDLSSAYPSAMALIGRPDWDKCRPIRDTDELLGFRSAELAFANVDFEFPDEVAYPVLPVRTENGLIFPRRGNSTTHISEILLAHRLGAKITLVEGRFIPSGRHGNFKQGVERPVRPFDGFTRYCIEQRKKFPKKTLNNLFWKELVNSTYGKTAQGLRVRRIYDLRDQDTKPLAESPITNPVYATFITAFCRGVLGEIMNALPRDVAIFNVTTDGFLTTATAEQMAQASTGTLCKFYRSSRRLLTGVPSGKEDVYEIKHIIRKPLGWRTRAQATLVPSEISDWQDTGMTPKEDERYVLAKGGIKLPDPASKPAENSQVIDLFFNRQPTDTMMMKLGLGIREMYSLGADFVDREMEKVLSMEFDWKRRPINPATAEGRCYRHLQFQTEPWDTIEQFQKTRQLWEQYNLSERHCLKTVDDLEAFASFHESSLSTQGDASKYLRKDQGDLKRLRQELLIAWKLRKAGTHELKPHAFGRTNIFPTYKLKAKEIAEILSDEIGVPCTKTDVDNAAKKTVFAPQRVPNTQEVRMKLARLRLDLFPRLEVTDFISGGAEFLLIEDR